MMKYHFITLGCPKNVVDSESMQRILESRGHVPASSSDEADVLIVNTCSFIQAARDEALESLHELASTKQPHQHLIAAGCMAESHPHLIQQVPGVTATLSTRQWMKIGDVLENFSHNDTYDHANKPAAAVPTVTPTGTSPDLGLSDDWRTALVARSPSNASAYIKVSDGCSLNCAFCTIPSIKGAMRSKPLEDVVTEAQQLVEQGVREIILVAQHLTSYGSDLGYSDGLVTLLNHLSTNLPSSIWIRLMYAYPQNITPQLIETMASKPNICAYLDIPLQHAHPDTLRRMHRPPDIAHTKTIIAKLREAMPDIALRSTFIVGFPGETNKAFQTLLAFLDEIALDWAGAFRYSREECTPAASLSGQVAPRTIDQRWHKFMRRQQAITQKRNARWIGKELDILVEGHTMLEDGRSLIVGRSFREAPSIDGQVFAWGVAPIGTFARVAISHEDVYDLWGEQVAGRD